jgi:hypothetical protein
MSTKKTAALAGLCAAGLTALVVSATGAFSSEPRVSRAVVRMHDVEPASPVLKHHVQVVDGMRWWVTSYRNAAGELCAGERVPGPPGDAGQGIGCTTDSSRFAAGPLNFGVGSRQLSSHGRPSAYWDNAWVEGLASPSVSRLELVLTNCSRETLPIDGSGIFFRVFSTREMHGTAWPYRLVAYDVSGKGIATERTPLGPPHTDVMPARAGAPRPDAACAARAPRKRS